jgi:two-component system chemotaxis response regulator CheY
MEPQAINVLHVEDSPVTRAVVRGLLQKVPGYVFGVRTAESEEAALTSFHESRPDLVILDYQLTEGDGLNCLRRLRRLDPIVPILAVSSTATPEVAAELLEGGADDFIHKLQLNRDTLDHSVRAALVRAAVWRARGRSPRSQVRLGEAWRRLVDQLTVEKSRRLLAGLREIDALLQAADVSKSQAAELAEWAAREAPLAERPLHALLREIGEFLQPTTSHE